MNEELNKSIDALVDELFSEPVKKGDLDVSAASKTTADAALNGLPAMEDDAARDAGRPKQISDVPKVDEDGKRDGQFDSSIASKQSEEEIEEAKQAKVMDQSVDSNRLSNPGKMKDPRISKSLTDEEMAEFEAFKKSKADSAEKAKQEELKKSEQIKKVETENLIKSAVESALAPLRKENEDLRKSFGESQALIKAMAAQPVRAKSVTGIEVLEKSQPENAGPQEFTKSEKLDAAEALVKAGKMPIDAVIELENTNTVYRKDWQQMIEKELEKRN